jgi:hypothetical protein
MIGAYREYIGNREYPEHYASLRACGSCMWIAEVCSMPRTIDGKPKWTAVSRPRRSICGVDRRFWDAAPRFRRRRQKPAIDPPDSAVPPMAGSQQRFADNGASERWLYFAAAVCFIAIIATFGMLIWQVARAFN